MSKKELNGKIIKDKNNKTVVVLVKRRYTHSFFGKVVTKSKKYHAHDEENKFKIGDNVTIIESKPYSKMKKWKVLNSDLKSKSSNSAFLGEELTIIHMLGGGLILGSIIYLSIDSDDNKIKDLNTLMKNSTTIQKKINTNIKKFESRINKKILSICAHGDWINRKYQFTNSIFVDKHILLKNSLLLEAYDTHFIKKFDCYITDTGNSKYIWKNNFSPINASQKKMNKLYILSHERTFHLNYFASWKSNFVAAYEKIIY